MVQRTGTSLGMSHQPGPMEVHEVHVVARSCDLRRPSGMSQGKENLYIGNVVAKLFPETVQHQNMEMHVKEVPLSFHGACL